MKLKLSKDAPSLTVAVLLTSSLVLALLSLFYWLVHLCSPYAYQDLPIEAEIEDDSVEVEAEPECSMS